ncbi:hypothetical protein RSOLAG22IIIB_10237 [Rhizoctonia solani]|uniref:F-box domain-containing protein n=1 Tax=Rhizoctonia solani TaxID=456999 RepID=A0A0K6G2G8_9AGAM|nr:hypothetical protein RSOLAG22IIIB_10237 [Rhizoctonia solani]
MDLPDIVHLVADFLSQSDRAHLAQASRFYFQLVMPLAWRTVTGGTQLFKLIPGARIETPGTLTGTETIHLPRNINTIDFARFKFYAKFVEHLLLFKNPAVIIKLNRWEELLRYTDRNTLLPSLSSISLGTYWPQSISHYAWIAIFSSPSIRQIETSPLIRRNLPTLSSETASAIFNLLVDRCPRIESLSIFVDPKQRTSPLENNFLSGSALEEDTGGALFGAIKHARRLCCTSSMVEHCQNTLLLLSRISELEVLQIYASQQDDANMLPSISLEPKAFSCLRSLALYDFRPQATLSILNLIASVAELTQLTLEINHNKDNKEEGPSADEFYNSNLIPTICVRTPRLTHLSIRPIWDDKSQVEINNSSLQLLASLCLKSFTLVRSQADVECLPKLFPRIRTLRWPDQPLTFQQLRQLVTYGQLEHLSMKITLSPPQMMESLQGRAVLPATPCVLEGDYGNIGALSQAEAKQFLVCLAGLSRPLILQQTIPFDHPYCDFAAERRLEELNKELKRMHREQRRK